MSQGNLQHSSRREFLKKAVALAGAVPLAPGLIHGDSPTEQPSSYCSLNRSEAAFTEAMVNALCPADHMTPDGVSCQLATFIDRKLAGEFGTQPSSLPLLTNEQFFKRGVAVVDKLSQSRFGARLDQLEASKASIFLRDIAVGHVTDKDFPLTVWRSGVVNPMLKQAAYAGPVYDVYMSRVFWKLFVNPVV